MLEKPKACPDPMEISVEEMNIRMDFFSRTFDKKWYNDSMKIWDELKKKGYKGKGPHVTTWDLYNNAFSFQRVRRYGFVVEGMNTIEQFEDNLNMNLSNSKLLNQFIQHAKEVQKAFNTKYHDGEFTDPATVDPTDE